VSFPGRARFGVVFRLCLRSRLPLVASHTSLLTYVDSGDCSFCESCVRNYEHADHPHAGHSMQPPCRMSCPPQSGQLSILTGLRVSPRATWCACSVVCVRVAILVGSAIGSIVFLFVYAFNPSPACLLTFPLSEAAPVRLPSCSPVPHAQSAPVLSRSIPAPCRSR